MCAPVSVLAVSLGLVRVMFTIIACFCVGRAGWMGQCGASHWTATVLPARRLLALLRTIHSFE